jgi:hypothetical protein
MTDPLRELFDDLVANEPPLRTTADATAAAGRRLTRRNRTLWTATGTAVIVAALAVLPQVWRPAGSGLTAGHPTAFPSSVVSASHVPTAQPTPTPTPTPTLSATTLALQAYQVCPHPMPPHYGTDASLLPHLGAAEAAVLAAAPRIAPGLDFRVNAVSNASVGQPKFNGAPVENLIFDVGDASGYGSLSFQITVDTSASAAVRATQNANTSQCVDGLRYDFADGSVALYYSVGQPDESTTKQLWYYGAAGITMNIGEQNQGYGTPASTVPLPPSTLPPRASVPLTIEQVFLLADIVAHAG